MIGAMKNLANIGLMALVFLLTPVSQAHNFDKGLEAARRGDHAAALAEWGPLAESGDALAQYNLGMMYVQGSGVSRDLVQAADWFRKAADQGLAEAQAKLGALYANGKGVAQDYEKAALWLSKAANQLNAASQYDLGVLYANGQGVGRDYSTAYFWFSVASILDFQPAKAAQQQIRKFMLPEQIVMVDERVQSWLESQTPR